MVKFRLGSSFLRLIGVFLLALGFTGCEDLIELDLNDAHPRLVIVGEVTNRQRAHLVTVHRSVPVSSPMLEDPVSGALVRVRDSNGRIFEYTEIEPGRYQSREFRGVVGRTYTLEAVVEDETYTASSTMPAVVNIDSIGTSSSTFFGEESRYIALKFTDPAGEPNYYRYLVSLNGSSFEFNGVFSDRFNDGLHVSHELTGFERELETGDQVKIQRQYIDEATYTYWRSIASSNPGSAAPANPPSNIGNGALGYFSAYSLNEYEVEVPAID